MSVVLNKLLKILINKILIPTDFSPASYRATMMGMDLCRQHSADLFLLHVSPKESNNGYNSAAEMKSKMTSWSKDMVEKEEFVLNNVVLTGDIEKEIKSFIDNNSFDLIIVGINSNGRDNLIGRHALKLIEETDTQILIAPNQKA